MAAKITGQRQVRARLSGAADPLPDFAAAERQVYDSLAGEARSTELGPRRPIKPEPGR